jgi:uncharacterized Zn finger protein
MTDYSELIDHLENRGDDSCTDAATAICALIAAHKATKGDHTEALTNYRAALAETERLHMEAVAELQALREELRMAVAIIEAELPHAPMLANFRQALTRKEA